MVDWYDLYQADMNCGDCNPFDTGKFTTEFMSLIILNLAWDFHDGLPMIGGKGATAALATVLGWSIDLRLAQILGPDGDYACFEEHVGPMMFVFFSLYVSADIMRFYIADLGHRMDPPCAF